VNIWRALAFWVVAFGAILVFEMTGIARRIPEGVIVGAVVVIALAFFVIMGRKRQAP
jgi:hypothetical protein